MIEEMKILFSRMRERKRERLFLTRMTWTIESIGSEREERT